MDCVDKIFSCTQCGYCCHGETTVSLDENDQEKMIEALGETKETVREKYWRETAGIVQMKIKDGHCIFFNKGCSVHKGRPWRCAEWPLHPSILIDENNFHSIAESCPGIKVDVGYEEFCRVLRVLMKKSKVVC